MLNILEREEPALYSFVSWCEDEFDSLHSIPSAVQSLLQCISSTSPVCSYCPLIGEVFAAFDAIYRTGQVGQNAPALLVVQQNAPVIFNALSVIKSSKMPSQWKELLDEMKKKCLQSFERAQHKLHLAQENSKSLSTKYFPCWPKLCERGVYRMDKEKEQNTVDCSKGRKGQSLMPGIFTVYCKHGRSFFLIILKL